MPEVGQFSDAVDTLIAPCFATPLELTVIAGGSASSSRSTGIEFSAVGPLKGTLPAEPK
jgi:hypothetical protein